MLTPMSGARNHFWVLRGGLDWDEYMGLGVLMAPGQVQNPGWP